MLRRGQPAAQNRRPIRNPQRKGGFQGVRLSMMVCGSISVVRLLVDRRDDRLIDRQITVKLPLGDLQPVVAPLQQFGLDVALIDVLAQRALDDGVLPAARRWPRRDRPAVSLGRSADHPHDRGLLPTGSAASCAVRCRPARGEHHRESARGWRWGRAAQFTAAAARSPAADARMRINALRLVRFPRYVTGAS